MTVYDKGVQDEYLIGNTNSFSVREIANMFSDEIKYLPERRGNRLKSMININKIKRLGWKPKHNIKNHISNFKKNVHQKNLTYK